MSELKERDARELVINSLAYYPNEESMRVYLKSEADKVIAELEENHKKEVEQLLILNREQANAANRLRDSMEQVIHHQKYKRCLTMAGRCFEKSNYHFVLGGYKRGKNGERHYYLSHLYSKWYERWRELAEKFKPNKEAK